MSIRLPNKANFADIDSLPLLASSVQRGISVEVRVGDITKTAATIIVNAANTRLQGGGGIDGAIHKAAGPQLRKELRQNYPSGCRTGESFISGPHNLGIAVKAIAHAVGPDYRPWKNQPDKTQPQGELEAAYINSLNLMNRAKFEDDVTILLPCISTGIFEYPFGEACGIALKTVADWIESCSRPERIKKIVFLMFGFGDDNIKYYKIGFPYHFPAVSIRGGQVDGGDVPMDIDSSEQSTTEEDQMDGVQSSTDSDSSDSMEGIENTQSEDSDSDTMQVDGSDSDEPGSRGIPATSTRCPFKDFWGHDQESDTEPETRVSPNPYFDSDSSDEGSIDHSKTVYASASFSARSSAKQPAVDSGDDDDDDDEVGNEDFGSDESEDSHPPTLNSQSKTETDSQPNPDPSSDEDEDEGEDDQSDSKDGRMQRGTSYVCGATTKAGGKCMKRFIYRGDPPGCNLHNRAPPAPPEDSSGEEDSDDGEDGDEDQEESDGSDDGGPIGAGLISGASLPSDSESGDEDFQTEASEVSSNAST